MLLELFRQLQFSVSSTTRITRKHTYLTLISSDATELKKRK